jgi:hypothetical protein
MKYIILQLIVRKYGGRVWTRLISPKTGTNNDICERGTYGPDDRISSSETLVNFYQTTWRNIPDNSHVAIFVVANLQVP